MLDVIAPASFPARSPRENRVAVAHGLAFGAGLGVLTGTAGGAGIPGLRLGGIWPWPVLDAPWARSIGMLLGGTLARPRGLSPA